VHTIEEEICDYSIFDSALYRNHAAEWLFPQEKATFDAVLMSKCEAKMLWNVPESGIAQCGVSFVF
jgi:hypothetical protein